MTPKTAPASAVILAVDDDPDVQEMLKFELGLEGFEVAVRSTAREGLAALDEREFDLLIVDVMLPDLSGYEVCEKVRARPGGRALPIMLLTALLDTRVKVKGLDSGADEFLTKPFEKSELVARVRALLRLSRLNRALQSALDERSHLQQMQAQLFRFVIHDLRGPLTSILGALDLLAEDPGGDSSGWLIAKARGACESIQEIVLTLLDIDRMDKGELRFEQEPLDASALVRDAVQQWLPLSEARRLKVALEIPQEPVPLSADSAYLKRALGNLLANAIRHSPAGETIEVILRRRTEDAAVELEVADRGPGVPPELREKVFEPGFSFASPEDRSQRGFGLGLTLCRLVTRGHGGDTLILDNDPRGSRFVLRFPAAGPAPKPSAK